MSSRPDDTVAIRRSIDELIEAGAWKAARAELLHLWCMEPGSQTAAAILSRLDTLRPRLAFQPFRLSILRSSTIEPVVPLLKSAAAVRGIDLTVQLGRFNAFVQDILSADSPLYAFAPDVVLLFAEARDLAPDLWTDIVAMSAAEIDAAERRTLGTLDECLQAFRSRSDAALVVHTLEVPSPCRWGVLDAQLGVGQGATFRRINEALVRRAREYRGVYVLDYDALTSRHGKRHWHDARKGLTIRLSMSSHHLNDLADEWMRFITPLSGRICKVLVVDLDNTLWGGVVGEDGFDGIKLGPEYPGAAFQWVQQALLDLHHRGIVLAVCSKNNPADALDVIRRHPGMLLREEHFAAVRLNWEDKAENLTAIARELNVGMDAIAFVDDNPAERQRIRTSLPDVTVIELPDDPFKFAETIHRSAVFERLTLSDEDRTRGQLYSKDRQRLELERSAGSIEDYYHSLQMTVEISPMSAETLPRAAQLTQKTNQFNLTTRRYSETQLGRFAASPGSHVYLLRLLDRFGDNGIVGLAILHDEGPACVIDGFLLSCRVIGRTVETALLAVVAADARERGAARLMGTFVPTARNGPASQFYPHQGFTCVAEQNGVSHWQLDLARATVTAPPWITCRLHPHGAVM